MTAVYVPGIDGDSYFEAEARKKLLEKARSSNILDRLEAVEELESIKSPALAEFDADELAPEVARAPHCSHRPIHDIHMKWRRAIMDNHVAS